MRFSTPGLLVAFVVAGPSQAQAPKLPTTLRGHTGPVSSVAFSGDGKALASGGADTTIKLWDLATGREKASLKGHTYPVRAVAFSPDGKLLASGGGGADPKAKQSRAELKLWDVATGKEKASLQGHTAMVDAVAFSPDGKTLASGSADNTMPAYPDARSLPSGLKARQW
jgi:WD40 repeat protein